MNDAVKLKQKALYSSLLAQEVGFMQIMYDLLKCKCLESARESWAGMHPIYNLH